MALAALALVVFGAYDSYPVFFKVEAHCSMVEVDTFDRINVKSSRRALSFDKPMDTPITIFIPIFVNHMERSS